MAKVVVTLKIMPDSPETDLDAIESKAKQAIEDFAGKTETKTEQEPIAFGLKAVKIMFVMAEEKGSTEELEKAISSIESVNGCEITDVRRAIG
ncbi:elongation factor 1-beta [Candidatus Woesearchaeota archaeon]|nr:elongation factor 1-beta [Candidatus Woesearchaeota archaeon]